MCYNNDGDFMNEKYLTSSQIAEKWGISERSVRNYCNKGRINGAVLIGKIWNIPENAEKPQRLNKTNKNVLLNILKEEKNSQFKGGIYHKIQIELTYNSNRIEGSKLSHEQTRFIYETNTIGIDNETINVDDIIETANHFRCIDKIIDCANYEISESLIKELHLILKSGTSDNRKNWFTAGDYKKLPNEVGGRDTVKPENVHNEMQNLINKYNKIKSKTFEDIIEFHTEFERIHPFQDGNGRVGRLLMFKECLKYDIIPFIIDNEMKLYYYRGLKEWSTEKGYLIDTCRAAQDKFKAYLDYFRIDI